VTGVRAVHHQLDGAHREAADDHVHQAARKLGLRRPIGMLIVTGSEQAKEDRQRDRSPADARQLEDQHDHDPTVPPPGAAPGPFRLSAVVQVVRAPHLASGAAEQRVVDRQADRGAGLDEHGDKEVQQRQPELVGVPARPGEEVVRVAVMPHAGQPGGLQHPRDRTVADPADEPDHEHVERVKRWLREARRQQGQQPGKRTGHGGDHLVEGHGNAHNAPRPDRLIAHRIRGRRNPSLRSVRGLSRSPGLCGAPG
jgi:hypothetical protein